MGNWLGIFFFRCSGVMVEKFFFLGFEVIVKGNFLLVRIDLFL